MRWRFPSQWGRIIGRSENRSTLFWRKLEI